MQTSAKGAANIRAFARRETRDVVKEFKEPVRGFR